MSCEYEKYTIRLDSVDSSRWTRGSGNQGSFTTQLSTPLKDITDVTVVTANFDASSSGSNVAYLNISQFSPIFVRGPAGKNSLAIFNVNQSGRTIFNEFDYTNSTQFVYPVEKISRLDVDLYDENGAILNTTSNVFMTLGIKCKRTNLCA